MSRKCQSEVNVEIMYHKRHTVYIDPINRYI